MTVLAALAIFKKKRFFLLLCIPSVFILFPFFKSDEVIYLDVGQGDGIYMHIDDNDILIDCGSTSKLSLGELMPHTVMQKRCLANCATSFYEAVGH